MNQDDIQIQSEDNPSHVAWHIDESNNWTPIGAAWPHKDGNGVSIQFNKLPAAGLVVLRAALVNLN